MRSFLALLVLVAVIGDVSAQSRRGRRQNARQSQYSNQEAAVMGSTMLTMPAAPVPAAPPSWRTEESQSPAASAGTITAGQECADALAEVNAARAQRGLRPYANDPGLAAGALACARARAQQHNHGHCNGPGGDFAYLPAGVHAEAGGCAAWQPSWGFGACAMYDNYVYCGAAWVMGNDGLKYCHLFVR